MSITKDKIQKLGTDGKLSADDLTSGGAPTDGVLKYWTGSTWGTVLNLKSWT